MSNLRKVLIIIVVAAMAAVTYFYVKRNHTTGQYLDLQDDGLGAERNNRRNYAFLLADSPLSVINFFNPAAIPLGATYKAWLPYESDAFSYSTRSANIKNAQWLVDTYDEIVAEVAKSVLLPRAFIYAIMLVETGSYAARAGFDKAKYESLVRENPYGAMGVMQVKPITATETVQIALNKGFISDYHLSVLRTHIGSVRLAQLLERESPNSKYFKDNKIIGYDGRPEELYTSHMNILIAALKIINLIDNYGEKNLHQVFYAYNQGDRTVLARGLRKYTDASAFARQASGEGKKYVERILGQNGCLDLLINDVKVFM